MDTEHNKKVIGEMAAQLHETAPEPEDSQEELIRTERISKKLLNTLIKSVASISPTLKITGNKLKASNKANVPLLDKYGGVLSASYIILKEKNGDIPIATLR